MAINLTINLVIDLVIDLAINLRCQRFNFKPWSSSLSPTPLNSIHTLSRDETSAHKTSARKALASKAFASKASANKELAVQFCDLFGSRDDSDLLNIPQALAGIRPDRSRVSTRPAVPFTAAALPQALLIESARPGLVPGPGPFRSKEPIGQRCLWISALCGPS